MLQVIVMKNYLPLLTLCGLSPFLNAYGMHEWGTFTKVSGSDGRTLTGLHTEEEHQPPFVYSHVGIAPQSGNLCAFVNQLPQNYSFGGRSTQNENQMLVVQGENKQYFPLFSKGMHQSLLQNVTVKMETPVLYFTVMTPQRCMSKWGSMAARSASGIHKELQATLPTN